jgi:hypothetical protein
MRHHFLLLAVAAALAACGDASPPTGPRSVAEPPAAANVASLRIAVDDGIGRLLPGVSGDAAGAIGDALRQLDASLRQASPSVIADAMTNADRVLGRFGGADRLDRPTLDALALELDLRSSR